jgi:uncharacterized protein YbbC (DUF1343 family)
MTGKIKCFVILFSAFGLCMASTCSNGESSSGRPVQTGLDILITRNFDVLSGMRVGLVTNHTARDKSGRHIVDIVSAAKEVSLTAIFSPEHGIRGSAADGVIVDSAVDSATGVPVYSLYGKTKKPTRQMLDNVDILLFDIQDIGSRYYTYIYTMARAMAAAARYDKTFVVLDRPNPVNGISVEGPVLSDGFQSFVGLFPLPVRHGMTVAELAGLFKGAAWFADAEKLDLKIIGMSGWSRHLWFDETGLSWTSPSPSMRYLSTATVYPGTCLFEGTNVSEGRGTEWPFEIIGAPWIQGRELAIKLTALAIPGAEFLPVSFVPKAIPPGVLNPKYQGEACEGIRLSVKDRGLFVPVLTAITMLKCIQMMYPDRFEWSASIDRLYGSDCLRNTANSGNLAEVMQQYHHRCSGQAELDTFLKLRKKYLLY